MERWIATLESESFRWNRFIESSVRFNLATWYCFIQQVNKNRSKIRYSYHKRNVFESRSEIVTIKHISVNLFAYSADDYTSDYMRARAMVYFDGTVFWPPPTQLRSTCKIDVTYFPFDSQRCFLKFGSWTYHGKGSLGGYWWLKSSIASILCTINFVCLLMQSIKQYVLKFMIRIMGGSLFFLFIHPFICHCPPLV